MDNQTQALSGKTLIVFYNRMWNEPIPSDLDLPAGCELSTDRRRMKEADAVVFHIPSLRWLVPPAKPRGQIWVAWSIECEVNHPRLSDPSFMRRFDLTMTYRQDADILAGYVNYFGSPDNLQRAMREPPRPKTQSAPVAAFISSRYDASHRREYTRELAKYVRMDSYGKFMRNKSIRNDRWRPSKLETIANYKFTLAFENAIAPDYVTEKFYDPLVSGSVPVYLGAPNVESFAPGDRCFINTFDYASPRELAEHLLELDRDPAAYAKYLEWKQKPFRPEFLRFMDAHRPHTFIRLCRRVQQTKGTHRTQTG